MSSDLSAEDEPVENEPVENKPAPKPQISIRTLFKITVYSAVVIYVVLNSWDHLGLTILLLVLFSPIIFFAEMVDWLLGARRK